MLGAQSIGSAMEYKTDCGQCSSDGYPPDFVPYSEEDTATGDTPTDDGDSTPACGAATQSDTDFQGGDLASDSYVGTETVDQCCQACFAEDACYAFTWSPGNDACGGSACCFLKGSQDETGWEAVPSAGAISGSWD